VFTDARLRRVLEVVDRRRPATQLRGVLTPALIDTARSLARLPQSGGAAVLRRIRLRAITSGDEQPVTAAEVFATYTRGPRVRVIAPRVEIIDGRWQLVALQLEVSACGWGARISDAPGGCGRQAGAEPARALTSAEPSAAGPE
jgi:hypothetical protein